MKFKKIFLLLSMLSISSFSVARNILLEFKGSYFLPTGQRFKDIYHNGSALYGPELTIQFHKKSNVYFFGSVDYLKTRGRSIGQKSRTTVQLIPLAGGVKYFIPNSYECIDFYLGLGFQAMNVQTKDCLTNNALKTSKWGFGGIAKAGAYCYVSNHILIDIFIDYSFLNVGSNSSMFPTTGLQPLKANVSGVIFGGGFGFRF